jgi:hypothetical protein
MSTNQPQKQGAYLAGGRRLRLYKKDLGKTTNNTDAKTERLRDCPITEPTTTPGNTSIVTLFGFKKGCKNG